MTFNHRTCEAVMRIQSYIPLRCSFSYIVYAHCCVDMSTTYVKKPCCALTCLVSIYSKSFLIQTIFLMGNIFRDFRLYDINNVHCLLSLISKTHLSLFDLAFLDFVREFNYRRFWFNANQTTFLVNCHQ